MTNEYACPKRNECGLYKNENPIFLGIKSPFRGVGVPGDYRGLNILDTHYRSAACEGAIGVPCFEACKHYKLSMRFENGDLGLSEVFPGSGGTDFDDEEGEEDFGLENMTRIITIEDGCSPEAPVRPDTQKQARSGKIMQDLWVLNL